MEKIDGLVADHLEKRLTNRSRLEEVLCSILTRRGSRPSAAPCISPRTEAEAKLNGFTA
ncbi:MAG: hypothetical protein WA733_04835 [Methylocystis sp.]|jgi:hypothetical protein